MAWRVKQMPLKSENGDLIGGKDRSNVFLNKDLESVLRWDCKHTCTRRSRQYVPPKHLDDKMLHVRTWYCLGETFANIQAAWSSVSRSISLCSYIQQTFWTFRHVSQTLAIHMCHTYPKSLLYPSEIFLSLQVSSLMLLWFRFLGLWTMLTPAQIL